MTISAADVNICDNDDARYVFNNSTYHGGIRPPGGGGSVYMLDDISIKGILKRKPVCGLGKAGLVMGQSGKSESSERAAHHVSFDSRVKTYKDV